MTVEHVFAYGSLASVAAVPGNPPPQVVALSGAVRVWNVAMDNSLAVPGYKRYLDPLTGEAPAIAVAFLNLAVASAGACVGVLVPVTPAQLEALDWRERNYTRTDVSAAIVVPAGSRPVRGPVWAYRGTAAARSRYAGAVAAGHAVVCRDYLETVEAGFDALGLADAFRASTRPPECPVRDLRRVDLPVTGPTG